MAVRADTSTAFNEFGPGTGSIREDLSDLIETISATDVPFWKSIGRVTATAPKHEWQTHSLAAAKVNQALEGDQTTTNDARSATARVGNYNQISRRIIEVSRTTNKANHAGKRNEMAFQVAVAMQEIRRDVEFALLSNNASVAGTSTTAREMGGIQTWIATNVDLATTGAAGGYVSTTGLTSARTLGTTANNRVFAESHLSTVMQSCFSNGARPTQLYMPPALKAKFSSFTSIATDRRARGRTDESQIVAGADLYISDFGVLTVIPSTFMVTSTVAANNNDGGDIVLFIDPDKAAFVTFDGLKNTELAKTSDGERRLMTWEYSLQVNNEKAHGLAGNLKAA